MLDINHRSGWMGTDPATFCNSFFTVNMFWAVNLGNIWVILHLRGKGKEKKNCVELFRSFDLKDQNQIEAKVGENMGN